MQRKIKVLHVVSAMNRGGIETYLMNMLRNYDRQRFDIEFCYVSGSAGDYAGEIKQLGSRLISCRMHRDLVRFIPCFIRLLKKGKYDVVDAHQGDFAGPHMLGAFLAGVAVRVTSYHNVRAHYRTDILSKTYTRLMHKVVERCSNAVTGCSKASLDAYFPGWQNRQDKVFKVRYYGIDYERFANTRARKEIRDEFNIPDNCAVVGHVGRFSHAKNHFGIVDSAELLLKRRPDTKFLLVGDGSLRSKVEDYVSSKGLSDSFIFTGQRADIPRLMSAMDVFFCPSINEGFGLVLLEVQAVGVPIVASSIAGIKEAVAPGYYDWLAGPEDTNAFADLLLKLLEDDNSRQNLVHEAKAFVEQDFNMKAAVSRFQDLYETLCDSHHQR